VSQDGLILAATVVQARNDSQQLAGMVQQVQHNVGLTLKMPVGDYCADAGYWTPVSITETCEQLQSTDEPTRPGLLVAVPDRWQKLSVEDLANELEPDAPVLRRQEYRQRCALGQELYRNRGSTVEPVFGQIKSARQCDRLMQRGLINVQAEWDLICATHNLLKLYRHQMTREN
jgi:hypothetical protein